MRTAGCATGLPRSCHPQRTASLYALICAVRHDGRGRLAKLATRSAGVGPARRHPDSLTLVGATVTLRLPYGTSQVVVPSVLEAGWWSPLSMAVPGVVAVHSRTGGISKSCKAPSLEF